MLLLAAMHKEQLLLCWGEQNHQQGTAAATAHKSKGFYFSSTVGE